MFAVKKQFLNLVFLGLLISGCATVAVNSDYDNAADFSKLKTYQWAAEAQERTGDPRIDNSLTDSRIRRAVDSALGGRGFLKVDSGNPDFLVGYQAAIKKELSVQTVDMPYYTPSTRDLATGHYYGTNWAHGGAQTFVNEYEEGTLYLDIVNPQTKKIMWRGIGKATVLEDAKPEKREARINEGVKKILSQFPPQG